MTKLASVVIPAHNEARSIARNLAALHDGVPGTALELVVVCNGCTDHTADRAREVAPHARVLETPVPSKAEAIRLGNQVSTVFPRVHLDADVELDGRSLVALLAPVLDGEVLATAPRRIVPRDGCSRWVRWYYDVWEQLPQVQDGLFGRGVVTLSAQGQRRVAAGPALMNDDLGVSEVFAPEERMIVDDAVVLIRPPRTVADLLRRRVRVVTGNAQGARLGIRRPESATGVSTLWRMLRRRPALGPKIAVFLALTLAARVLARPAVARSDYTTWHRDESSRG